MNTKPKESRSPIAIFKMTDSCIPDLIETNIRWNIIDDNMIGYG